MPQTRKIGSRPPAAGHRLSRPMCAASPPHAATKGTLGVVHTAYSIFSLEGLETLSTFGVYVAFVTGLRPCLRGTASSLSYACIAPVKFPMSSLVHTSRGRRVSSRRPLLGVTSWEKFRRAHYLAGRVCFVQQAQQPTEAPGSCFVSKLRIFQPAYPRRSRYVPYVRPQASICRRGAAGYRSLRADVVWEILLPRI